MAKAIFIWDAENIAHVAQHGLTPAEIERGVQDPRLARITSRTSGRPGVQGKTKTSKWIIVFWEQHRAEPWTIRVITSDEVPRSPHD